MAPPAVQDERARILAEPILYRWGLSGVPIDWYYPAALGDPILTLVIQTAMRSKAIRGTLP